MYVQHFGLRQAPFSIAPDPHYLFMSERHREALAHLLYGIDGGGGFVLLSGEIGTGKTTVCRCFLEQIPSHCDVAYIFNPKLTVIELLQTICEEFHIVTAAGATSTKDFIDPLNQFLLERHSAGRSTVLIIDEAQNLSPEVLEQLRLLTNLETNERKLLQIVLIGQPELRLMLAKPELEQLAQRVIARFHLEALSGEETSQYIAHRLAVAGHTGALPFEPGALKRIHQVTRGVPRRINLLCDRALLGAYAHGQARVNRAVVNQAASEVFGPAADRGASARSFGASARTFGAVAAAAAVLGLAGILGWFALSPKAGGPSAVATTPAATQSTVSTPTADGAVGRDAARVPGVSPPGAASPALATTVSPKAPLPSVTDMTTLLATLPRERQQAWRALTPRWGLAATQEEPCAAAAREQVQCLERSMSLSLVRQIDRPGILTLYDAANQPVYALLTGLSQSTATLSTGSGAVTVPLLALAQVWRGEFATLWRNPPGYSGRLKDASTGPVIDWIAARLALAQGEPVPSIPQRYDSELKARVQALQRASGLDPDGRVGALTLIQINRASGIDEPRLSGEQR